jgi:hypothetical protein
MHGFLPLLGLSNLVEFSTDILPAAGKQHPSAMIYLERQRPSLAP